MGLRKDRKRQSGMTLIELMLAITMLVVGLMGVLALITTAISSNTKAKMDTTGTWVAQMVLENIISQPANANTSFNVVDCNPAGATTWQVNTTGAASPGAGTALIAATGAIDFNSASFAAAPTGYKMRYVACGANQQQATYEVRWNIQNLNAYSKMVTVSARSLGAAVPSTATMLRFYSPPVTVRTIVSTR